jgi:DNA-3-methyladenine glycosylase II
MTDWDQQDTARLDERIAVLARDPVMARLVDELEPPRADRARRSLFHDLVDAIASQQLSVHAAAAIMERVVALFPSDHPDPATLLALSDEELRAAGLSRPKIRYLKGIAGAVNSGEFDLEAAAHLEDAAFVERLTVLPGVGRWTAEMLLIFALRRPDVFPIGDLGIRNAVARLYDVDREDHDAIVAVAERWRPFRSLACHYLWSSLNNAPTSRSRA